MPYNEPDKRWEIFGFQDYETYVDKLVVKGLFNKSVPVEVTEAFLSAEHIMAQAWYHYPLYDEAFSKLLRIIEMAVRLRCADLAIPLSETRKNKTRDRELSKLITDLKPTCNLFPKGSKWHRFSSFSLTILRPAKSAK